MARGTLGLIAPVAAPGNDSAHPSLVVCAHGARQRLERRYCSTEWVQRMGQHAASDGYKPTTIEQFISDFPRYE